MVCDSDENKEGIGVGVGLVVVGLVVVKSPAAICRSAPDKRACVRCSQWRPLESPIPS